MRDETGPQAFTPAVLLKDYDWCHVFACANDGRYRSEYTRAGEWDVEPNLSSKPSLVLDAKCSAETFWCEDVAAIFDSRPGEHDGAHWLIAGVLNDGRFFFIEAGCDYTGWGCQSSGSAWVSDSLRALYHHGMTDEAREVLPGVRSVLDQGSYE